MDSLNNANILVTGGTGFIGGKLVEKLVMKYKSNINVLVRDFSKSSRISRFPIKMFSGDIMNRTSIDVAMENCDFVFHCAYDFSLNSDNQMGDTLSATKYIAEACLRANVKKLIYISTISVYGNTDSDIINETTLKRVCDDTYGESKLA